MIVGYEDFARVYDAIKQERYHSEERKVIVFVSTLEADSVCALRILQGILNNDSLHYSIFPVSCYSQIERIVSKQFSNDQELRSFIFINCGGCEDLVRLLSSNAEGRLIVVDSRRPISKELIHEDLSRAVVVASEADDLHPGGREALPDADGASGAESDSDDDLLGDENAPPGNRPGSAGGGTRRERRKKRKREVRQRRKNYYAFGAFWGRPAAYAMLRLAQSLEQDDKHSLWLAAVALTDQLVHQRVAPEKYAEYAEELSGFLVALDRTEAQFVRVPVEDENGEQTFINVRNPTTRVTPGRDFRFALLRHWSLYEAMLHSPHVAVRLQTWSDKGRRKLEELLAKMGFRMRDCQQDFSEMRSSARQSLEEMLAQYGPGAHLTDVTFDSFHLQWGYRTPLSATDAVHAVCALLESHASRPGELLSAPDAFWAAWHALNPGKAEAMQEGLEQAKRLQIAILRDGGQLIQRKDVRKNCARFCWVDLSKSDVSNKALLSQPLALAKLGVFLREQRSWKSPARPEQFVLVFGPADAHRRCLVVGVARQPHVSRAEGNTFPLMFRHAAEAAHCEVEYDGFDTCIGMVPVDSIERLVNEIALAHFRPGDD